MLITLKLMIIEHLLNIEKIFQVVNNYHQIADVPLCYLNR